MKFRIIILFIGFILLILSRINSIPVLIVDNFQRLEIANAWLSQEFSFSSKSDYLHDGIPDGWAVSWWGGADAIYKIEGKDIFQGVQAARVTRTNDSGSAYLTQDVVVKPGSSLLFTIYVKGSQGAVQIWARSSTKQDWIKRGLGGYLQISSPIEWQGYALSFEVPKDSREIRVVLTSLGDMLFDEAYLGEDSNGNVGQNLLLNPGFELDGQIIDNSTWWKEINQPKTNVSESMTSQQLSISYENITDMLQKRFQAIRDRSKDLNHSCAFNPEMTGWLINLEPRIRQEGGNAALEQLYILAIDLAPNCPLPYAYLAELYASNSAFWPAAELYHKAAEIASGTILSGKYSFEEGVIRWKHTGELEQAIYAFQQAEKMSGWEPGGWYLGVASYDLGQVLERTGQYDEAKAAYQRVLDCKECFVHRDNASSRLKEIDTQRK